MEALRVLHIEDDDQQREELAARLDGLGHAVRSAASGSEGVELLQREEFDVVLCDLNLPRMSGFEVMEQVKPGNPDLPFIILTAHGSIELAVRAIKQGAYNFVTKPLSVEEVDLAIHQAVEHVRTQRRLRRSERQLSMLMETVPDIIYSLDPRGHFLNVSAAGERILGYKVRDMLGESVFKIVHPDDLERVKQQLMEAIQNRDEEIRAIEFRMISASGKARDFEVNPRLVFEDGAYVRNDGIARDVTERKQLEARLLQADELLHKVIEASPVPLIISRVSDGTILFANEHLGALVGYTRDELVGQKSPDFYVDPADRQVVLSKLREHGQIKNHEVRFKRRDGSVFWSFISLVLGELAGDPVMIGGVIDIDEQKRIEEALRWERNFVSAVLDTAGALVVVLDQEGRIFRFNTACQETTGYTLAEVEGKHFWDLFLVPEELEEVQGIFRSLTAGDFPSAHENYWLCKDGSKRLISWSNTALVDGQGDVEFVIATGIDITEVRQATDRLKLYRELFMHSSDGIMLVSTEGKIIERNPAHREISGVCDEEVCEMRPTDLFDPQTHARLEEALAGQGRFRDEVAFVRGDGERVDVDLSFFPVHSDTGELLCFAGIGRDVTERKQAEAAIAARLRYEEALAACSQALLDESSDSDPIDEALGHLLVASDSDRVYIFKNVEDPELGLCLSLTNEVCSEGVEPQLDNPDLQHAPYSMGFDHWRETLSRGEAIQMTADSYTEAEREILGPQGILSILVLPFSVAGKWYGFIGFDEVHDKRNWSNEDVRTLQTAGEMIGVYLQRKRVEEALRFSEERFRRLVENAEGIIYSLDPDGKFTYISPKFTELTGHRVADYIGKPVASLLHQEDLPQHLAWLAEGAPKGVRQRGTEYRVQHQDSSWRWFSTNASVLRDEEGGLAELVGVAHDITEMKQVLQDLEQANWDLKEKQSQLVQSEKMASLGMLVAGIAHEINTPIGAVNSMHNTLMRSSEKLKALLQKETPELYEQNRRLKTILKAIDDANQVIESGSSRVTNIVRRLKSFARLDEAELKQVDIHEGLEDTLAIIHHEIKHKMKVTKSFGDLPPIACYPGPLNQVFLNLFINANQAIGDKGELAITTRSDDDNVYVEISDTGQGIPPQIIDRIFDPGFTTKGVGVGTGLGLSICYQIIQDHHGQIQVQSTLGEGSTFTVVLPRNLDEKMGVVL